MAFFRFLKLLEELETDTVLSWTQRAQPKGRAWEWKRASGRERLSGDGGA